MLLARGHYVILGLRLLEHQPLRTHVVARVSPIPFRIQIAQMQGILETGANPRQRTGYLARHESLPSQRRFMVEKDTVARIQAVSFAIVHADPMSVELGDAVRRARIKWGGLALWSLLGFAEHLGRRGLVKARALLQPQYPDGLKHPQRAEGVCVGRIFRGLERDRHVTLRRQIVDFIRLDLLNDADEVGSIREVAVVK